MSEGNLLTLNEFRSTRNYMQDVSKIIGKLQQLHIPEEPYDWHRGLPVSDKGLITSKMIKEDAVEVHYDSGEILSPWGSLVFTDKAPTEILNELSDLSSSDIPIPEFDNALATSYDLSHASYITSLFAEAQNSLVNLRQKLAGKNRSSVLLYPHHFDLALSWFPTDTDDDQITYGFSTGDETVPEPYFYILSWPNHDNLEKCDLPDFAQYESDFNGILIKLNDAPDQAILGEFLAHTIHVLDV